MRVIDISREILSSEIYPGDPTPKLETIRSFELGDEYALSAIHMGLHNGTHIDAPSHFWADGVDIVGVSNETFLGPCTVIEVNEEMVTGAYVERYFPPNAKRVIIKSNGKAVLHESAATALAYMGYILVGTDNISIEDLEGDGRTHRALLGDNISILEGLNLKEVKQGEYFLVAPPLKIAGAEAAPCRAFLIDDHIFWSGTKR